MTIEELTLKAKQAKSVEELLAMAKENDIEMDEQSAAAYFAQMNQTGELADDELENVAGGGCYHDGRLVVTVGYGCEHWRCKDCGGKSSYIPKCRLEDSHWCAPQRTGVSPDCNHCKFCSYEDALWLCNHEAKRE